MEALRAGSRGGCGYPTTGLRLGRTRSYSAGSARAGKRRLRNGRGHPARLLLGLFSLVDMCGGGDVSGGELMRFFAEAAWYPTALLPTQGVRWEAVDGRSSYPR